MKSFSACTDTRLIIQIYCYFIVLHANAWRLTNEIANIPIITNFTTAWDVIIRNIGCCVIKSLTIYSTLILPLESGVITIDIDKLLIDRVDSWWIEIDLQSIGAKFGEKDREIRFSRKEKEYDITGWISRENLNEEIKAFGYVRFYRNIAVLLYVHKCFHKSGIRCCNPAKVLDHFHTVL